MGDVADKWGGAAAVSASLSSAVQQKRRGESTVIAARAEVD
jgi:hypothetical protein